LKGVEAFLDALERRTFEYFDLYADPHTGLVCDSTREDAPASIAGSGLALGCYAVASERGWLPRAESARRARTAFRFLWEANQEGRRDGSGAHGFFYHFLDPRTGRRSPRAELSTIDSAIVFAGALAAVQYFDGDDAAEREIRALGDALYRRADWTWASPRAPRISMGWRPESGFLPYDWSGYDESLLLFVLALGSPTHAVSADAYATWTATFRWKRVYGYEYLYGGPLFMHQGSHAWIDLRGIQDAYMRERGIDYFENSRRATYVQREYARRNPRGFAGYGERCWGITASAGPGPATLDVSGRPRRFRGYHARGAPFGPDDGTLSPWAAATSLPFAPEIVLPTLEYMTAAHPAVAGAHGYRCSFNPTFPSSPNAAPRDGTGWISPDQYAIDQGPLVLMLENFRSGLIWRLLRACPYVVSGLRRAGFTGGWLSGAAAG
jgi:hypothetical protein